MPKDNQGAVAEAPATEQTDTRSRRQRWREESTITVTEKGASNPKKPNSASAARYDILLKATKGGKAASVADLFRAGYRMDDVRHDVAHGFIALNQPFELGSQD